MDDNLSLQQKVFDQVLRKFDRRADAVDALAGLLSLGKNAVYRRIRGDSLLTLGELYQLARHFDLSLDTLLDNEQPNQILFTYSFFSRRVLSVSDYLSEVHDHATALLELPEARLLYTSQEIPMLLYFNSPLLFAFKMYVYASTYWGLEKMKRKKFSFQLIGRDMINRAQEIASVYTRLPSTELWSTGIVDNTLNQIKYFATTGGFEQRQYAFELCDAVRGLVQQSRRMAETGQKLGFSESRPVPGNRFDLYFNEFSRTNDNILVEYRGGQILYTTFGTPNFLKTNDSRLCTQVREWLQSILNRSIGLSIHSGAERERFFLELERRIQLTYEQIDLIYRQQGE